MKRLAPIALAFACIVMLLVAADAQQPAGKDKDYGSSSIVTKMMAFNKKKDGKLTKEEVTDPRLHRLFDLADANKDGIVTREELIALAAKMEGEFGQGGGKGDKGPGDKGPKGDKGPGGDKGDKGGKGFKGKGPPQPGQILPPFIQEQLNLTADQKKQLDALQKDVDERLSKILTDEQKMQLKELGGKGPKGKGPPPKDFE